jgi:hypothetical protein
MSMKAAVIAALEAWVVPGAREAQTRAQVVTEVLAVLDLRLSRSDTGERIQALAPSGPWE